MVVSNSVHFWLYLIPLIPSLIFTIVGLYRLRSGRTFGIPFKDHYKLLLLSCVLIGELFDVPCHIHYYHTGAVLSSTPAFCIIWAFISSATSVSISVIIAWTSVERHIVTFYPEWHATSTKRFFFHYFPLSACISYPTLFYLVIFSTVPCDVPFNYDNRLCNRSECIFRSQPIALWDSITHYLVPVSVTMIFTVTLLARVVYYRYHTHDKIEWNKYKKIAVQLSPVSVFYILLQLPPMILYTAYSSGVSRNVATDYYDECTYFRYWIMLFIPFIYAIPLTKPRKKRRTIVIFWGKRCAVVQPVIVNIAPQHIGNSDVVVSFG